MISRLKRFFTVGAVSVMTAVSSNPAEACAVCFGGENDNRWAFIGTTALLTFLPLLIFAGGVVWIRKQYSDENTPVE